MGDWVIVVEGTGPHHNGDFDGDADKLSIEFVGQLLQAGQLIRNASFTAGTRTVVKLLVEEETDKTEW